MYLFEDVVNFDFEQNCICICLIPFTFAKIVFVFELNCGSSCRCLVGRTDVETFRTSQQRKSDCLTATRFLLSKTNWKSCHILRTIKRISDENKTFSSCYLLINNYCFNKEVTKYNYLLNTFWLEKAIKSCLTMHNKTIDLVTKSYKILVLHGCTYFVTSFNNATGG